MRRQTSSFSYKSDDVHTKLAHTSLSLLIDNVFLSRRREAETRKTFPPGTLPRGRIAPKDNSLPQCRKVVSDNFMKMS